MSDILDRLRAALAERYEVVRELGEGGMATVYLARDLRHQRDVALKVLKPELAAVVGSERFLAEIRTTANLQHPHILPLHESGEADGFLFYVMPYVKDESLRDRLDREHQLPVGEAVAIARKLAQALDYAHRARVIHRDLKPANVLLVDGNPVLSDFGIALAVGAAGGRLTETGLSLGTPHYMSPEQATGEQNVDGRTDTYALGCVLYEMLVGQPPHRGPTAQAVLGSIVLGDFEPVQRHRPQVPEHVVATVEKALERVPADRFRTAGEMDRALTDEHFRHGSVAAAGGERGRAGRLGSFTAAAALVLALVVGWATGRWQVSDVTWGFRHSTIMMPRQDLMEAGGAWGIQPLAATREHLVSFVAAPWEGLDDHVLAVNRVGELWSKSLEEPDGAALPGTRGAHGVFASPDGSEVGFLDLLTGDLERIPIDGGPVQRVASLSERPFMGGAWTVDDTFLYAVPSGIWSVPLDGGAPRQVTQPEPGSSELFRQPRPLPGGEGVVFTVTSADGTHRIASVDGDGRAHQLVDGHTPLVAPNGVLVFARGTYRQGGTLWIVRLSGAGSGLVGEPVRVLDDLMVSGVGSSTAAPMALAPDGTLFYVTTEVRVAIDLDRFELDGRRTTLVEVSNPQFSEEVFVVRHPKLSPDGTRLAFSADHGEEPLQRVFVMDLERGAMHGVQTHLDGRGPVWSRDGSRLFFSSETTEGWEIVSAAADGSGSVERVVGPVTDVLAPYEVTPDGRWLLYGSQDADGDEDIWIVPLSGDEPPRPIKEGPAGEWAATLSPDGSWMAYVTSDGQRTEIYVDRFPDGGERRLVSTGETGAAFAPAWRGDQLFFLSEEAALVTEITTSPNMTIGPIQQLFETRIFPCCTPFFPSDVSPDGSYEVWIAPGLTGVPRIEMVTGWLDAMEARLGG